ncbi:hypothetical protein NEH83_37045 [Streptomyces sp. JUS-F4]|uniref:hypothetical protein n=1 Tax=Streptomyces TaxID=1883 RepID=UPI000CD5A58F|nr:MULTISPECIES: hypothetical protein [Streptomyces]MDX2674810.1 hypothetical protein [Streptomyces sp. NRRL_ISP-5395]WKN12729.1 hypothetical protein NEH83_00015 [Streptomyces sp. JUS-F4]WKN19297.1 hypothetical protein NEH83_37045 [Streptomyces sp. JUS-F4]GHF92750.1 hypothetical protein GCM10010504_71290 [Streptomyces griseus]
MFDIDGITAAAAQETAPMPAVTFDLFTAFVTVSALVLAWLVYRKAAPAPGYPAQATRGERLVYAITAATAVIAIGGYLGGGIRGFEYPEADAPPVPRDSRSATPAPGPATDGIPASPWP